MARKTKAEKRLDDEIDRIYRAHCNGVQVNVLDLGKIFAAGHLAAREGRDMTAAILECVARVRLN